MGAAGLFVCCFVLCKRHWINRVPGAHRGDSLRDLLMIIIIFQNTKLIALEACASTTRGRLEGSWKAFD